MIDKDKNQVIVYTVDEDGGKYRASVLMNATDPEDPTEIDHPLNVGQGMNVSCIGRTPFEAKENLLHGLRMWGFKGEFVKLYSDRDFEIMRNKPRDYKRPKPLPNEEQSNRMLKRHYLMMDNQLLEVFKVIEGPTSRITRIINELQEERNKYELK